MSVPVLTFSAEILTDAPFNEVAARLREPASLKCLRPFGPWSIEEPNGTLVLTWSRRRFGSAESVCLSLAPHDRGTHLSMEGRHKGWLAFATFGLLRWHGDQLLERLVEEL